MPTLSRREWMIASASLAAAPAVHATETPRERFPRLKVSLAAYSFREALDLKKPSMTLLQFIDFAASNDIDAVELTGYYFAETTPAYLAELKHRCTYNGLDVSGSAVGNDFCVVDAAKLKMEIAKVKEWIGHTSRLGGKTLRVFAGQVAKGDNEKAATARSVAALQDCCRHAADYGVFLALENHGGITSTPDQVIALYKAVEHRNFGVNLDSGNFRTADPYGDLAKIAPYAVNVQLKTEITPAGKPTEEADLPRLVRILRDVKYRGYVALEYEAKEDPKTAVPQYLKTLKRLAAGA